VRVWVRVSALSSRAKLIFLFIKKNQNISAWFTFSFFFFDHFIFVAANWQRNIIYVLFMIAGFSFFIPFPWRFSGGRRFFSPPKETCLIYLI